MRLAVVTLRRSKTGLWTARKVIPESVRARYGKREEKRTWPATLTDGQAKAELAAWLAGIEDRIALLRSAGSAVPLTLTGRQCRALAGEWYTERVEADEARFTDSTGDWDWEAEFQAILPEGGDHESGITRLRPTPHITAERDRLVQARGLRLDGSSSERLLREMLDLYLSFLSLMQRRVESDYGPDPVLATLPALKLAQGTPREKAVVSITDLFEEFANTGAATPHTVLKWRKAVALFVEHLGHDDATRVQRADGANWFGRLIQEGRAVRTVQGTYRAALARVFKIAHDRGKVASNPFTGLEVIGPKAIKTRRKDLNDTEARTILEAALKPQSPNLSPTYALALRWVPWICAYTGARVNEITQLRAMDIRQEDGVWVFHITPEAGSVKTREARSVPIHSCLIAQGILKLAKAEDATPLFYDPSGTRKNNQAHPLPAQVGSKLAKWVRSLGVVEVESPNHGWRHRFKSLARQYGMNNEARDRVQGHAPRSEGEAYGSWPVAALRDEIEYILFTGI